MITNNFDVYKKVRLTLNNLSQSTLSITVPPMIDTSNTTRTSITIMNGSLLYTSPSGQLIPLNALNYNENTVTGADNLKNFVSMWIGKSNAEEAKTDYRLDAFNTSEVTASDFSCIRSVASNGIFLDYTRTFQNISGAPITIKELGFLGTIPIASNTAAYFLFDRRVLPEPIVLADQASYTFSMVYEF